MNVHLGTPLFGDLLVECATWLLAGCGCWAALICAAALLEAATGGRLRATAWVGCPRALRSTLLAALGVALVATPGQASAVPGGGSTVEARRSVSDQALPVPARPLGAPRASPRIVVRPGDTLWHLAASRLPATATAAEVCEQVERLHRRNLSVIGPDPDLIRPGQRLALPRSPS